MSIGLNEIDLPPTTGNLVLATSNTQWDSVAMSGDAKITGGGALTVQPNVITNSKLSGMTQGTLKYGNSSNQASDLAIGTAGQVLLATGTDTKWTTLSGGISVNGSGVVTVTVTPTPITVTAKTTNYTVLNSDLNTLFTNTGAAGVVTFSLPTTAVVGTRIGFAVTAAQTVNITAPSNGILTNNAALSAVGTTLSWSGTSSLYSSVELTALTTATWLITQRVGAWTLT